MTQFADSEFMQQHTLAHSFRFEGVGIHTGEWARVVVHPADVDTGRMFRVNGQTIPAQGDWVMDTRRCTTLGREQTRLHTVEHLLSALHAFHVDNALIEVEGTEIPILDGSSLAHTQAIQQSGIIAQGKLAPTITLTQPIALEERGSRISAEPASAFEVRVSVEFDHWPEGNATQMYRSDGDSAAIYTQFVAPARTFAFRQEVEQLLAAGLARGGSLDNALIITPGESGPAETPSAATQSEKFSAEFSTPLRLPQEWCVHKLLDVIGDLALFNARPLMTITALKPGHGSNVRFVQATLKQEQERRSRI